MTAVLQFVECFSICSCNNEKRKRATGNCDQKGERNLGLEVGKVNWDGKLEEGTGIGIWKRKF
jgi:hypothetical protein